MPPHDAPSADMLTHELDVGGKLLSFGRQNWAVEQSLSEAQLAAGDGVGVAPLRV